MKGPTDGEGYYLSGNIRLQPIWSGRQLDLAQLMFLGDDNPIFFSAVAVRPGTEINHLLFLDLEFA